MKFLHQCKFPTMHTLHDMVAEEHSYTVDCEYFMLHVTISFHFEKSSLYFIFVAYNLCHTIWRVIFGGAKFREKSKPAFRINFHDYNFHDCHPNKRAALRSYVCTYDRACPSDRFQIGEERSEELHVTSCCLNSIDAGY